MLTPIMAGVLGALALAQQADTIFTVERGARLDLSTHNGSVVVRTWNRDAVRVEAELPSRARLEIGGAPSLVSIAAEGPGSMGPADYRITVPAAMAIAVRGTRTDIVLDGVQGEVLAETVEGEIEVRGGVGRIVLSSVSGSIVSRGARGQLEAINVSGDVRIHDAVGAIQVETISGDVLLAGISAERVDASAVSGDIAYSGAIGGRGRYQFSAHSGDITLSLPEPPDALVTLSTLSGDFETMFPLSQLESIGGRRRTFILGSGSATLDIEAFSGDVTLRRGRDPASMPPN